MNKSDKSFVIREGVLEMYKGNDDEIIVPNGVNAIGSFLMGYGAWFKKVIIPKGVKEIKDNAFNGINVEEVVLPSSLKRIGKGAFSWCSIKEITIPYGIETIPNELFMYSKLAKIVLPESIKKIGDNAFLHCINLRTLQIPCLESVSIGESAFVGCDNLCDANGFLILQNRLLAYRCGKKVTHARIPDEVEQIDTGVFNSGICHLEMSINCPSWKQTRDKRYGNAHSLLSNDGSSITFRDNEDKIIAYIVLAIEKETLSKQNNAILSIKAENGEFDFSRYDKGFFALDQISNKIRMALARTAYPYMLSNEMRKVYASFIRSHEAEVEAVGKKYIEKNNIDILAKLMDLKIFTPVAVLTLADYALTKNRNAIAEMLLYGETGTKKASAKSKLARPTEKKQLKNKEKWRKSKTRPELISRYMGDETEVVFPFNVGDTEIIGIADKNISADDNYKEIVSVVLPEGYTYIGNNAFSECESLERIHFPSTLKEIGAGAFRGCCRLKEIFLHKDVYVHDTAFNGHWFNHTRIDVLIMEMGQETEIPGRLFENCDIGTLVVYGGKFSSTGRVFTRFPDTVYTNYEFSVRIDKYYPPEGNLSIHPLDEFDETVIMDPRARKIIAAEKKKAEMIRASVSQVSKDEIPDISFDGSYFTLSGFNRKDKKYLQDEIRKCGGRIKAKIAPYVNYLVISDESVVHTAELLETLKLQSKGNPIVIIKRKECLEQLRNYSEKVFGKEGMAIAEKYLFALSNGEIRLKSYIGKDKTVTIPEKIGPYPVVEMSKGCFCEYKHKNPVLRTVIVPKNIKTVPANAFAGCRNLHSVTLEEGVESIEATAFAYCSNLKNVTISNTVISIGTYAFYRCKNLNYIKIPEGVQSLNIPFFGCTRLSKIKVDEANPVYDSRYNCNAIIETATDTLIASCRRTKIPPTIKSIAPTADAYKIEYYLMELPIWTKG
ncbi:MAG: leucine-rich repeat domain-containing protein [Oscillospiraceae bacterium]|nr:leucine-rich repeat domain-containing protein [Clostridia bacterium]MBR0341968.1 leucine-rich repeat domain-containing protein [Oscillospiraceae bacterium]